MEGSTGDEVWQQKAVSREEWASIVEAKAFRGPKRQAVIKYIAVST
jgi:ribosomal protein S26